MDKKYYSWNNLNGQCLELARQITQSGFKPDYVVGLTRGGLVPAVMLSHFLNVPMEALKVSLRDGGECETNCWMSEDALGYVSVTNRGGSETVIDPFYRKNILVVDDINDSGATINWIKKDWQGSCLPDNPVWNSIWHKSVRFAVLTNNLASSAEVDFYVEEVNKAEQDVWLVYPWESFWNNDN